MWTLWTAVLDFSTTFRHKAIALCVRLEIYVQNTSKLSRKNALLVMFVSLQGFLLQAVRARLDTIALKVLSLRMLLHWLHPSLCPVRLEHIALLVWEQMLLFQMISLRRNLVQREPIANKPLGLLKAQLHALLVPFAKLGVFHLFPHRLDIMLSGQALFFKQSAIKERLHQFRDLPCACLVLRGIPVLQTTHHCRSSAPKEHSGPEILCKSNNRLWIA
jgi:hypothetical protein